jgi:hypothetical protein
MPSLGRIWQCDDGMLDLDESETKIAQWFPHCLDQQPRYDGLKNPKKWQHPKIHRLFSFFHLILIFSISDHHKSSLIYFRFIVSLSRNLLKQKV